VLAIRGIALDQTSVFANAIGKCPRFCQLVTLTVADETSPVFVAREQAEEEAVDHHIVVKPPHYTRLFMALTLASRVGTTVFTIDFRHV